MAVSIKQLLGIANNNYIPLGGTEGQVLAKNSNADFDVEWKTGGSGGGVTAYDTLAELPLSNTPAGEMAFVSENNRLYIWNGSGWFNIALINTNPTITSGAASSYLFARDGTPTVITLSATDPEEVPITWSYQITSGTLGNTAIVTQDGNEFTITPSTDINDAGIFEITFTASDGINLATSSAVFTLIFGAADQYYNQSIVLTTLSTNNSTNNAFIDAAQNRTVNKYGNATQGSFSPFSPAGWSGHFDGTGDYLTIATPPTSIREWWTTDFTLEMWVYPTSYTGWYYNAGSQDHPTSVGNANPASTSNYWSFGIGSSTGQVRLYYYNGSPTYGALTTETARLNQWNHIALTKNSSGYRIWVNGVGTSDLSISGTPISSSDELFSIGQINNTAINGHISNLRIVKGSAIYNSNFDPSTVPLTVIANTSLLTLQDHRFRDRSINNFTIVRNGDAKIAAFSPFVPGEEYDPLVHGGSGYFDGTDDCLDTAVSGVGDFYSANFTIEAWIYPTATTFSSRIATTRQPASGATGTWGFNISETTLGFTEVVAGEPGPSATVPNLAFAWHHIAVCRSSSITRIFLDGVQVASATQTTNFSTDSYPLRIAQSTENKFPGYITDLRISNYRSANPALYTTNFSPPTAPLDTSLDPQFLLNFTNAGIFDETGKIILETVGDAKTSTSVVKYGITSMAFDGTGDYLKSPASTALDFGTGDFTIETWVYFNALSTNRMLLDRWASGNASGWQLYWRGTGTSITFFVGASVIVQDPNASNITTGTWYHVAVTRSGTTVRLFVNGTVVATNTSSVSFTNTLPLGVGIQTSTVSNPLNGYLSDTRITKGYARYTANFTPPTAKLGYSNNE